MDWTQFWSGIIGAVLGSITTGFFTIWVAKMNMKENIKSRNEERKFFFHTNRPEFEVIDSTKITQYEETEDKLEILLAHIKGFDGTYMKYSENLSDKKYLNEITFKLKNVGKTDIDELWISVNYQKTFCIFKYKVFKAFKDSSKILQYRICYDNFIRQGSEIDIKFVFEKDVAINNGISAPITLWFKDVNGNWWSQAFFVPRSTIYKSIMESHSNFKKYTDEDAGLSYFRDMHKPW